MPYPNEHAARVRDPGAFEPNSFRSKDLKNGVRLILAKLKGQNSMVTQAYRFSVDKFTVEQAKQWLENNKVHYIKFEPAQIEPEKELQHVGVLGMKWGVHRGPKASDSSDHVAYSAIRKKKLKDLTDDEINTAVTRMRLVSAYSKGGTAKRLEARRLSNKELESGIKKRQATKEILRNPVLMKFKELRKLNKMTDPEVDRLLSRINLETSYNKLKYEDFTGVSKFINQFIKTNPVREHGHG